MTESGEYVIAPTVSLASIDKSNLIVLEFTHDMEQFDINATSRALNVSIEGPMGNYSFNYTSKFKSNTKIELQLTLNHQVIGKKKETCTIIFDTSFFKSTEGAILDNDLVDTYIYQKQVAAEAIKQGGAATGGILGTTMGTIIITNILLGDEIELLWGFMNTLQIITYFPFLQLYLPQFLSDFIESLAVANLKISISFVDTAIDDFYEYWFSDQDYDLETEDETYQDNDIHSLSIIRNAASILSILVQGLVVCLILHGIKAKFITVQDSLGVDASKQNNTEAQSSLFKIKAQNKKKRLNEWFKKLILDMCAGYKYHFFIRLGFQLYLEGALL